MRRPLFLLSALLLLLPACATLPATPPEARELDVKMEPKLPSRPLRLGKAVKGATVPRTAATNWQAFFKAPPTAAQTSLLAKKLAAWPSESSPAELRAKARTEMAIGRLAAAEVTFRQALRAKSDDLEALLELSSLYLRQQKLTDSFALLAQAKDAISTSDGVAQSVLLKYRYTLALALIARGERDKGHKILSDLIGIDKTFTPAYTSLAASYLAIGRDSVAEFVVKRGLDRVHDNASLLNLMGVIAQRAQAIDVARGWFDKALTVAPSYAPALVNRAVVSATNLEYAAAEEDLVQALKADPQNVDALVALGVVQKRQGNLPGAKASFAKAIDTDPDNAYGRYNLAALLADDLKKPNEALRLFHEVLATPAASSELRELARTYINDLTPSGSRY